MRATTFLLLAACHGAADDPDTDPCDAVGRPSADAGVTAPGSLLVGEAPTFRCDGLPAGCVDLHLRWLDPRQDPIDTAVVGPLVVARDHHAAGAVPVPDAAWAEAWCTRSGHPDAWTVGPATFPVFPALDSDVDGDGLVDPEEVRRGTDRFVADTDGDGVTDGDEVDAGTDPLVPTPPPPHELCGGGVDEDHDHLVDCEDDDCATSPSCVESLCGPDFEDVDGDGDGLAGCADDDCWGRDGCPEPALRVAIHAARGHATARRTDRIRRSTSMGAVLATSTARTTAATFTLSDVTGTVERRSSQGALVSQCTFTLDRARWLDDVHAASSAKVTRSSDETQTRAVDAPVPGTGGLGCAPGIVADALPLVALPGAAGWDTVLDPLMIGSTAWIAEDGHVYGASRPWLAGAGTWTSPGGTTHHTTSSGSPATFRWTVRENVQTWTGSWPTLSGTWRR